jgi:hypothetical protein
MGLTMRAAWKWLALALAVGILGVAGAVAYTLSKDTLLDLQSCVDKPKFTGMGWVCGRLMASTEPSADEIAFLNSIAGAGAIVGTHDAPTARHLMKRYLAAGLDVNAVDQRSDHQWTALHFAALSARKDEARLLLEFGADPSRGDAQGRTPADVAREGAQRRPNDAEQYLDLARLIDAASARP